MRRELRGSTREKRAAESTALRRHEEEQRSRELHIVKKVVYRLGGTACCRACERVMIGPSCRNHAFIGVWTTDDRPQDSERPGPEVLVEAQPEAAEAAQQERKRRVPRGCTR